MKSQLRLAAVFPVAPLLCGLLLGRVAFSDPIAAEEVKPSTEIQQVPEVAEAIKLFQSRDFQGTLEQLKLAAEKNTDLPPAQVMMAELFARANQGAAVRSSLESAVVQSPSDPEAYVLLGELALRGRRVTEGHLCLEQAASLLRNFDRSQKRKDLLTTRVLAGLAAAAEARRQWPVAEQHLLQWLKADPKSVAAMQRLARALFQQGRASEALDRLKAAEAADPENVLSSAATLARFYQQAGDEENAKKWIDYALKKSPQDARVKLIAARMYLEMGNLDAAEKNATAAMQLDPKSLPAMILSGVVALFRQDYRKAEQDFQLALLEKPGNFEAKNNLALALAEQDDETKKRSALAYAKENAQLFPQRTEAVSTYGWALYQAGQVAEADRIMQQLLRSGNFTADTAYYIARIAMDQGRQDQAKQLLEAALDKARLFSRKPDAEALLKTLQ